MYIFRSRKHADIEAIVLNTIAVSILSTGFLFALVCASCKRWQTTAAGDHAEGIVQGADYLTRSPVFAPEYNPIERIAPMRARNKEYLGIFATSGVYVFDLRGEAAARLISFEIALMSPIPVDVDGDGTSEFIGYGEAPFPRLVVHLDESGKTIWKSNPTGISGPGVVLGDLDRDGTQEVYFSDGRGVGRMTLDGQDVWYRRSAPDQQYSEARYTDIGIYESEGRDSPFLLVLTSESMGELYDGQGTMRRRCPFPKADRKFCLIGWPCGQVEPVVISWKRGCIVVMDVDGGIVFEHDFPEERYDCIAIEATPVRFRHEEPPVVAILVSYGGYRYRGMLCVFSCDGKLLYQEHLRKPGGLLGVQGTQTLSSAGSSKSPAWSSPTMGTTATTPRCSIPRSV